jgi:mRNA interferase RelE/StbE
VRYEIRLMETAVTDLRALPLRAREAIVARIEALADDPTPNHTRPLRGELKGLWRLRVGDYRVAFTIDRQAHTVSVWRVGHRESFYERAKRGRK